MTVAISVPPPLTLNPKFPPKLVKKDTSLINTKNLSKNPSIHPQTLHAHLIKTGLLSDLFTSNTLIHGYCQHSHINHAHQLFDEMPHRNLVSWTSLISGNSKLGKLLQALEIFVSMLGRGFLPNEFAFGSALRSCSESEELQFGEQLHGLIVKLGLLGIEFLDSGLISLYSKSKSFDIAMGILERMEEKDVFSWTSMIVGYSNGSRPLEAVTLFFRMIAEHMVPSEFALTSVLKSCASMDGLEVGSQIHGYSIKVGFGSNSSVRVSLVDFYARRGELCSARLIYEQTSSYDLVLCTVMIGGYSLYGNTQGALEIFQQMIEHRVYPNEFTFANLISSISDSNKLRLGKCIHALSYKTGHSVNVHVEGALINMYSKNKNIEDALKVFDKMVKKDAISCSSLLAGLSCNGYDQEALDFFSKLHRTSAKLDPFSLAGAIASCAKLSDQLRGRQIHSQIIRHGHEHDTCIASALTDMYARSGTLDSARQVFDNLLEKDRIAWTVMIDGYAQHGQGRRALELFYKMIEARIEPNCVTFASVLCACSHSGLIQEGLSLFRLMDPDYGIKPIIHHYACIVDLLGRAGHLEDALEFIHTMPIKPTPLIWRSFLGACRNHKNIQLGIYASKHLLELDPEDETTYVLLGNLYSSSGYFREASEVRNVMRGRGLRKTPGLSWVEVGKSFHVFGCGDLSHPRKEFIYKKLEELMCEIKKIGYVPETGFSLHNVDEDEKERLLQFHSEKLAITFAVISTPEDSTVRVFKNLRICGDCHSAIKYISRLSERKIIVRDVSRFHHFSDGVCSCGDYW